MDGVNIEDLTIEQYLKLTQENHAPNIGVKVDDMTIAEYLEYEETIKTQDYDDYQPHSTKASGSIRYRDHVSPRHKILDPPLDTKTNPYFQTSLSYIHPKTTKILTKHTREDDIDKKQEQNDEGLGDWFEAELERCWKIQQRRDVRHYWKSTNDDDRIGLEWNGLSCTNWVRARYGMVNDVTKERILQKIWNNTLEEQTQEKTSTEEQEDPEECGETKTRAIIREMVNKLPEEWFSGVSEDKDDLEGIIDYLEPTLYDGSIDLDDEAYKLRRNKLLGMPYSKPPPILREEAEATRYNLGAGEDSEARRQLSRLTRLKIMW
ncbi:hypothetical protein Tco_0665239 [Tanacetum coccineum]